MLKSFKALTASAALCAGVMTAGAAEATTYISTGDPGISSKLMPSSSLMGTVILDLSGLDSMDELFDPDNVWGLIPIAPFAHITSIAWDLSFYADDPSYLSEANIYFDNSDLSSGVWLTPGVGDNFPGTASYSGFGDLVDLGFDFFLGADGYLYVELFESYDDYIDDWDGYYLDGSTITVGYEIPSMAVPEAKTWAMLLAGFGFAGLMMRRRKPNVRVSFS